LSNVGKKIRNIRAELQENLAAWRKDRDTGKHGEAISPFYQLFSEQACK
jgi:hypothetical protein